MFFLPRLLFLHPTDYSLSFVRRRVRVSLLQRCIRDDGKQHAAALFDNSTKTLATQNRKPCWQLAWNMLASKPAFACSQLLRVRSSCSSWLHWSNRSFATLSSIAIPPPPPPTTTTTATATTTTTTTTTAVAAAAATATATTSGKLTADHFCLFHSRSSLAAKSPPPVD
ncbi:hypothetical protein T01_7776 [Trichinella spiralis]|uniref:Uncharacterized protein n=1 Tax=Trichinella spiralis TaxID=6334 RepID=A0A0V1AX37_TRISP|nr:hypothetical protein T01_7776 [Trichinella spiralis]